MTSGQITMLVILIAYMVVVLVVGLWASRRIKGSDDFLLAGRSMGLCVLVGTLCATQLGGGNIIGTSTNGYNQGLSGMTFGVSTGVAMLLLGLLMAKPMRKMGLCTISDFVYNRYQSNVARVLTAGFSFAALIGILAAQVGAIAQVLTVFGMNVTMAAVLSICIIIVYTAFSGMWGVALTDVVQLIVIFIGVPLTTIIGLSKIGGWDGLVEKLSTMSVPGGIDVYLSPTGIGWAAMLSIALPMIAYELIGQDFYQRLLSAKSERIAKTACIISGSLLIAMGVDSGINGMLARAFLGDSLSEVSPIASLAVEVLPTVAAGLVIAGLCAAVMSTADSVLLACTSHVINDIYLGAMGKSADGEDSSKAILRMSVITTVVVGIAALFIALAIPGIIRILSYAYTFYASGLVAPVLLGLFWKRGKANAAVASIIIGGVSALLGVFNIIKLPIDSIILGIGFSFTTYVVIALVSGEKKQA